MFRLRSLERDKWCIVDLQDEKVFVGSYSECEDWLDRMENIQRQAKTEQGFFRRVLRCLSAPFSRHSRSPEQSNADPNSEKSRISTDQSERVSN